LLEAGAGFAVCLGWSDPFEGRVVAQAHGGTPGVEDNVEAVAASREVVAFAADHLALRLTFLTRERLLIGATGISSFTLEWSPSIQENEKICKANQWYD
jgi:hypothetical protein